MSAAEIISAETEQFGCCFLIDSYLTVAREAALAAIGARQVREQLEQEWLTANAITRQRLLDAGESSPAESPLGSLDDFLAHRTAEKFAADVTAELDAAKPEEVVVR